MNCEPDLKSQNMSAVVSSGLVLEGTINWKPLCAFMFIWFLYFKGVKDAIELENELNINFSSERAITDRLNKHPIIVTQ